MLARTPDTLTGKRDPERRSAMGRMSREEARRIAVSIAAIPELQGVLRDKD